MRFIADEVRSEEIERKRKPKNPFVIYVETVFILMKPSMFVHELHSNIVPSII